MEPTRLNEAVLKRDDELQRLIRYAQGMGLSVHFKPYIKHSGIDGGWTVDGSEINIYVKPRNSKIDKVLALIHEIGHHKGFVENNRQVDPKVIEAMEDEEEKKASRKRIYLDEMSDTQYWEQIYKNTNCQFGLNKLRAARDFDIWAYEVFYETGKFPSVKEKIKKAKDLRNKYRNKNE